MDAHGAMQSVGKDGGRIGDVPPVRFDCATGLTPQGRKRPRSIRPSGQKMIREVLMQAYRDLRQDCLLWLKANETRAAQIATRFGSGADGGGQSIAHFRSGISSILAVQEVTRQPFGVKEKQCIIDTSNSDAINSSASYASE
jgi:hypothetical protein